MKITFWTASQDGSSWYRAALPRQSLGWAGHDCVEGINLAEMARPADVLVASRPALPGASNLWQDLSRMQSKDRPFLVADMDDDYFSIEQRNEIAFAEWSTPGLLDRLRANLKAADRITVASQGIAEAVERETDHRDIVVIENGLHAAYLATSREYSFDRRPRVGWAGSGATSTDYDMVDRAMRLAARTFADLRYVGLQLGKVPKFPNALAIEWCFQPEHYLKAVQDFDIWLAPYRPSTFNEAKFPTKAMEAGFLGIPLIASDIRPYREWIVDGENGFLIPHNDQHLWTRRIRELCMDAGLRRKIGEAARSRSARNIMQSISQQWEVALTR